MITLLREREDGKLECIEVEGTLEQEIETLLNKNCIDDDTDTPDFILAEYLMGCLKTYKETIAARDKWFGFDPWSKRRRPIDLEPVEFTISTVTVGKGGSNI
jgi:hypothetical protein